MRGRGAFLAVTAISHIAFAWLPFEAKRFNSELGAFWGSATFYLVSLCLSVLTLALFPSGRREIRALGTLGQRSIPGSLWLQFFLFSAVMVLAYYHGLSSSPAASFQIWTRFDMFFAFILAYLLLRERFGRASFAWTLVGFGSWLAVLPWHESNAAGLWHAILYVCANGYLCVVTKRICAEISEGTLYLIRTFAVMLLILVAWFAMDGILPRFGSVTIRQWAACLISAVCLAGVIYFRFSALRRGPLWLYSACGVIQVGCLKFIGPAYGEELSAWELSMGVLMFVSAGLALRIRTPEESPDASTSASSASSK